jgi:hypothetical protein
MTAASGDETQLDDKANRRLKLFDQLSIVFAFPLLAAQCVQWWIPTFPTGTYPGLILITGTILWLSIHRHRRLADTRVVVTLIFLSAGLLNSGTSLREVLPGTAEPAVNDLDAGAISLDPTPRAKETPIVRTNPNLMTQKLSAKWETSNGERFEFASRTPAEERKGYAKSAIGPLEDGSSGEGGALVATAWEGGWTRGEFSLAEPIKATDRLVATVGLSQDPNVFTAKFRAECLGGTLAKPIQVGVATARYDDKLTTLNQSLHNCAGAELLRLYTVAEKVGTHLVWVTVQIMHE